jgi:hypothetical protein
MPRVGVRVRVGVRIRVGVRVRVGVALAVLRSLRWVGLEAVVTGSPAGLPQQERGPARSVGLAGGAGGLLTD